MELVHIRRVQKPHVEDKVRIVIGDDPAAVVADDTEDEATWEREDELRKTYPDLFAG
jgi:hypothetical protein